VPARPYSNLPPSAPARAAAPEDACAGQAGDARGAGRVVRLHIRGPAAARGARLRMRLLQAQLGRPRQLDHPPGAVQRYEAHCGGARRRTGRSRVRVCAPRARRRLAGPQAQRLRLHSAGPCMCGPTTTPDSAAPPQSGQLIRWVFECAYDSNRANRCRVLATEPSATRDAVDVPSRPAARRAGGPELLARISRLSGLATRPAACLEEPRACACCAPASPRTRASGLTRAKILQQGRHSCSPTYNLESRFSGIARCLVRT